jgi:hypothetical protein
MSDSRHLTRLLDFIKILCDILYCDEKSRQSEKLVFLTLAFLHSADFESRRVIHAALRESLAYNSGNYTVCDCEGKNIAPA